MSLDPKHKNIGATVSMVKIIAQKAVDEPGDMAEAMAEKLENPLAGLFVVESNMCDHKVAGACTFDIDQPDACISPPDCNLANCPLGALVDEELKLVAGLEE